MRHTLSVLVRTDAANNEIRIAVEGCVTPHPRRPL